MPWGDGTGPWWAKGNDKSFSNSARGRAGWFGGGRGYGRGRGRGYGRFYSYENDTYASKEEIKREIDWLTERINILKNRLKRD